MLRKCLPGWLRGGLSLLCYAINTFLLGLLLLLPLTILKLLFPFKPITQFVTKGLNFMVHAWTELNHWQESILIDIHWDIRGLEAIHKDQWYLLLSNHQSWVDIIAVFAALHGKIPTPKFFIKQQLIWMPIIGQAAWACDFPFMRRYSQAYLKRHPEKRGKDIEQTRRSCQKFRAYPMTLCNYAEGTRITPEKHKARQSKYKHLLNPKAGGVGFAMGAMGDIFDKILDLTIIYPNGKKNFWQYLSSQTKHVIIDIKVRPITEDLIGDYFNDRQYKARFQQWLNHVWAEKDELIEATLALESEE